MKSIILIIAIALGYIGFVANQWYGLATGFVASLLIGSSLLILLDKGSDMSIHYEMRVKQRIGGGLTLLISIIFVFLGGWKYGWLWVIIGYIIGVIISSLIAKKTVDSLKANSNNLIKLFKQNAFENLGYKPDKSSIDFFDSNYDLSALLWEMLGDAGGNNNLGIYNPEWEKQCDFIYENYVQDKKFRQSKPGAHAMLRYAVYLCDKPTSKRCSHPADDY